MRDTSIFRLAPLRLRERGLGSRRRWTTRSVEPVVAVGQRPAEVAREAQQSLARAGASVTYREIDNLSHTYPVEENPRILEWMSA